MFKFRSRALIALPSSTTTLPTSSTLSSSVLCFPSSDQPPSSLPAFSRPNPARAAVNKIHDEVLELDTFVMTGAELESWRGYVHIAVETILKAQAHSLGTPLVRNPHLQPRFFISTLASY
jgi:hypothetical protein